jgi:hypothetical protein
VKEQPATIRFEGLVTLFDADPEGWERSNGHASLDLNGKRVTADGAALRLESPVLLANAKLRNFVVERWNGASATALVLAGDRDNEHIEVTLRAPLTDDEIEAALGHLHAALTPMAWVPPPDGTPPNYHDLVWAAAAGRVGELSDLRKAYEHDVGRILDAYWPHNAKVGVAAVEHNRRWRRNVVRLEQSTGDLRAGDWSEVLLMLDHQASRAHNALHGVTQRTAVLQLCSVAAQIYPHFDVRSSASRAVDADPKEVAARKRDLGGTKAYIDEAARREVPIVYAAGMVAFGIPVALVLATIVAVVLWGFGVDTVDPDLLSGCIVMGALGAVLSVLQRLGQQVAPRLDVEAARDYVRLLGAVRPLVGAVFGLALYFALASGLLFPKVVAGDTPSAHVAGYLALAFLAGFNERWATGALGSIAGGRETEAKAKARPKSAAGGEPTP